LKATGRVDSAIQFGLTHKDDLQQFLPGRFQIAQQPNLLEHLPREKLRFVNDQDASSAAAILIRKESAQAVEPVTP